jgi:hypothetical protein
VNDRSDWAGEEVASDPDREPAQPPPTAYMRQLPGYDVSNGSHLRGRQWRTSDMSLHCSAGLWWTSATKQWISEIERTGRSLLGSQVAPRLFGSIADDGGLLTFCTAHTRPGPCDTRPLTLSHPPRILDQDPRSRPLPPQLGRQPGRHGMRSTIDESCDLGGRAGQTLW